MDTSLAISVSGMRVSQTRTNVAAHDIANVNTDGFSQSDLIQKEERTGGVSVAAIRRTPNDNPTGYSNTDLAKEIPELMIGKNAYGANAKVIKVQDRMLGEVIDLIS